MKIEHSDKVTDKPKRRCVSPRIALTSRRTTQYFWSAPHGHVRENGHAGNRKCVIFINGIKEKWSLSVWKASVKLSVFERARFLFFTSTRGTNDQLFNKKKTQSENYRKEVNTLKMGNWKTQTITSFDISWKIYCPVTKRFATDTTWLASGLRLSPSVWKGTDNLLPVITKFTLSSENVPPNKA